LPDELYLKLGGVEVADQLAGLDWLKKQAFVDADKVAVYGWSYGGYMVLKLLEARPGAYAAGISGAPVTRWELYDTHYTERYLGNPAIDPKPYEAASALTGREDRRSAAADPRHGRRQCRVRELDRDHRQAQETKRPFEMMVYPGATHAVTGEGRQTHVWSTIERFLDRTVRREK
jgi:dipeptidyl-peptidase-4